MKNSSKGEKHQLQIEKVVFDKRHLIAFSFGQVKCKEWNRIQVVTLYYKYNIGKSDYETDNKLTKKPKKIRDL